MAKHSATHFSNRTRKACQKRTAATLERYHGKLALAASWKEKDPAYARELSNEAEALRKTLEMKGAL